MKRKGYIIIMFVMCITQVNAQSADRFIRIVGNASQTFTAHLWKADVSINEVKASEHRNTVAMPLDEVYSRFVAQLKTMDIPESALQPAESSANKMSSATQRIYQLTITDLTKIQGLIGIPMDGVRLQPGKYSFPLISKEVEKQMAMEAIEDARRKAESLAQQIGMKVGKLLNIEDTSTGCCGEIRDAKEPTSTQVYHVNVTFQLKG